ncbi:MAG: DNA polymerase III subunit delta [Gammaproteobacteria bacterium]
MKLSPDKLPARLSRSLAPVYLVSGDEPLLVGEACDAIRAAARVAGFTERTVHVAERGFDWAALESSSANLSLFAEKRILEIRLPTGKPGTAGGAALAELAELRPPDTLLLVVTPKLDSRTPVWAKRLDAAGVAVQVWPVDAPRLPRWIDARMRSHGLQPEREAVALLAERVEGNLLAASQEIEKLLLLAGPGPVDVETVRRAVADSARFDVYQLGDAALAGEPARALRILDGLRAEGVEPPLVLWALARELRSLATAACQMRAGRTADQALAAARVWPRRQGLVRQALARHDADSACALVESAARADRVVKGNLPGKPWPRLSGLVAALAGPSAAGS